MKAKGYPYLQIWTQATRYKKLTDPDPHSKKSLSCIVLYAECESTRHTELKKVQEKMLHISWNQIRPTADFPKRFIYARRKMNKILKPWEKKNSQPRLVSIKYITCKWRRNESFLEKQKLAEFTSAIAESFTGSRARSHCS